MSKFYKLRVDLKLYLKDHNCILKQDSVTDHPSQKTLEFCYKN